MLGDRTDELEAAAAWVEGVLAETPGTRYVRNTSRDRERDLRVRVERDRAALAGVAVPDVDRAVRLAAGGVAGHYREEAAEEAYDVRVTWPRSQGERCPAAPRRHPACSTRLYLAAGSGAVPLSVTGSGRGRVTRAGPGGGFGGDVAILRSACARLGVDLACSNGGRMTFTIVAALVLTQAAPSAAAKPKEAPPPAPVATPAATAARALPVLPLREAIVVAQRQNLDIQQVNAKLDEARQATGKAWSYYLPQIAVSGNYTRNELQADIALPATYYVTDTGQSGPPPGQIPPGQTPTTYQATVPSSFYTDAVQVLNQWQAQASANQALIAPQAILGIVNAYSGVRVAEYSSQQARRDVLFGVAQLYYGIAGLKELVIVQERQVDLTRERERDARVRFNAGTSPKVGLLRAEIDRAQAEEDLKRAQIDFEKAKLSLAQALTRDNDFDVEIPPSPRIPQGPDLEQQALDLRPDVKAAAEGVKLAEGQRTQVIMEYLPSIGAFFNYRYTNVSIFTGQAFTWQAGAGLTWNIFDGGLREANIREASAKIAEAKAAKEQTDLRTTTNVKQFKLELEAALANKAKAIERAELARENARLVDVAYKAGAATYLESTDSVQTLRQAEVNVVAESLNVDLATLRLLNAVGAFQEAND
ncbi:MAG TPA: TolC family protein [Anaeromyxobacteraceae bacterium]|nr:TolC family protein [Anaeromyxobacteraceae bacterium]